jgi:5-methyltetrahydrofolate--homocysteine methyltransferase
LAAYRGKPLLNSVTGEEERLERILPLVKKYGCAVIGISNDETGISEDPDQRFAMAKKIVERAEDHGIPRADVLIDPLVMPVGAVRYAGRSVFRIIRRCVEELGVNTCCGASNVSFGLPGRPQLNAAFLSMALGAGLPCAITNPLEEEIKMAILAADVMIGNDENCITWLRANRGGADRAALREGRRAARRAGEQS